MSHIFISYSHKDVDFASNIVQALAQNSLETWIDWKSIPKGEYWEQEIHRGIEEAEAFLFLISPDSIRSQMCNKEIAHADPFIGTAYRSTFENSYLPGFTDTRFVDLHRSVFCI